MRISDWSSDVCSSDLAELRGVFDAARDADYEELTREVRALCESEYVAAADVSRLRKRLNEIAAIDFFGAHGRQATEAAIRSDERRVGNERVRTCRYRWSPEHYTKKKTTNNTYS